MYLGKRDNMGYAISPVLIVFLIMIGAAFVVCMGYGIHRTYGFRHNGHDPMAMSEAQQLYMIEVRARNMEDMAYHVRRDYFRPKGRGDMKGDVRVDIRSDVRSDMRSDVRSDMRSEFS